MNWRMAFVFMVIHMAYREVVLNTSKSMMVSPGWSIYWLVQGVMVACIWAWAFKR